MLDGMRDGATIAPFASFLSLFAAVSLSNLTPRVSMTILTATVFAATTTAHTVRENLKL